MSTIITDAAKERLAEVRAFLDKLDASGSEHAAAIRKEFDQRLGYLDAFGGTREDGRRLFRVTLGRDWAPYSFSILWEQWSEKSQSYEYAFNGGLIWHGGSNDPLTVTLTPQWWGILT